MSNGYFLSQNKNNLIIACMLSSALIPLNTTMIAAALPEIGNYFNIKISYLTTSLVTSYLLINLLLSISAGKIGDIYGRRYVLNLAHLFFTIGILLSLIKSFFIYLVIARLLMAIGGTLLVTNTIALICSEVAEDKRVLYLGFQSSLFGFSAAFGPLIGGVITHYLNWQAIFLINLPLLLISFILVNKKIYCTFKQINRKLVNYSNLHSIKNIKFWDTNFIVGNLLVFTQNLILYGILFSLPFLLKDTFHSSSLEIGKITFLMTISMSLTAFAGGVSKYDWNQNYVFPSLLVITILSLFALYFALISFSQPLMFVSLCLIGCGIGFGYAQSQNLILSISSSNNRGVISGIASTIRYAGSIIGILIFTCILNSTDDLSRNTNYCILIYISICIFSLLVILFLQYREANNKYLLKNMNT